MVTDIHQLEGAARMAMGNFDFNPSDETPGGNGWIVIVGFSAAFLASLAFVALLFI